MVNYSGGVGIWDDRFASLNAAVTALVRDRNVPFFTSSENYSGDACNFAPNSLAYTNVNKQGRHVFVVGASDLNSSQKDVRWRTSTSIGQDSGSNGGACVSIYAPGANVYIAGHLYDDHYVGYSSGSSFSSPLVAAVAARFIEQQGGAVSPYVVYDYLLGAAASTGVSVQNASTSAHYLCINSGKFVAASWTASGCPTGSVARYVPATTNSSNAGILYSDMVCP